jgi:sporulation protein YlmC with PRC-barrel domain
LFNVPALIVSKPHQRDPLPSKKIITSDGKSTGSIEMWKMKADSKASKHSAIGPIQIWINFTLLVKEKKWKSMQAENNY